ncbi:MAG TPA: hypothetical protein VMD75_17330 [Candidatus Binataceae bacterium]|jgi:hypothetical protein|nr:hypothetical protein [Candidatus Binataceae bacterium]
MASGILPTQFAELEQFGDWIITTERGRHLKRLGCSFDEIKRFYDAMLPRMDEVMRVLAQFEVDAAAPAEATNLYLLALSFMEVSHPIELRWSSTSNRGAFPSIRLEIPDRK